MGRSGRRSAPYDWISAERGQPHWIQVRDMTGCVFRSERLEVGTDLVGVLIRLLAEFSSDGWQVENFSRETPGFFCNKDGQRRHVTIYPSEPEARPQITQQL